MLHSTLNNQLKIFPPDYILIQGTNQRVWILIWLLIDFIHIDFTKSFFLNSKLYIVELWFYFVCSCEWCHGEQTEGQWGPLHVRQHGATDVGRGSLFLETKGSNRRQVHVYFNITEKPTWLIYCLFRTGFISYGFYLLDLKWLTASVKHFLTIFFLGIHVSTGNWVCFFKGLKQIHVFFLKYQN